MGSAGVAAIECHLAFELFDAILHHHHLGHEVLHLLAQRPQHPDQLILLCMAELVEVGQVWHQNQLSLTIS